MESTDRTVGARLDRARTSFRPY